MRRSTWAALAVVALLASCLTTVPGTALAQEREGQTRPVAAPGGLAATPARLEIGVDANGAELSADVAVTNRGAGAAQVHVTLADLIVTQAGAYETADAGQTPYSVSSVASIERENLDLDASGEPGAAATVHLLGNVDHLARPLYGALVLELDDQQPPIMDLAAVRVAARVRPSIVIPIVVVPLNTTDTAATPGNAPGAARLADTIDLVLQGLSLSVTERDSPGPLDRLIPISLPGVADHGPLAASSSVQNQGNAFGRAFTKYAFAGVNPVGWLPESVRGSFGLDEHPYLEVDAAPAALMPDMQGETHAVSTYATGRGGELDSTPWFGLVRVQATSTLVLADFVSQPVVQEGYVLVLPWKEGLVVLAAWRLWCLWRGRRSRRAIQGLPEPVAKGSAAAAA
jgi:hypothetical protein